MNLMQLLVLFTTRSWLLYTRLILHSDIFDLRLIILLQDRWSSVNYDTDIQLRQLLDYHQYVEI